MGQPKSLVTDTINGSVTFTPFVKNHNINIGTENDFNVVDILIHISGQYDQKGRSIEDIQVHINSLNITQELRESLLAELNRPDGTPYREQYRVALDNHYNNYPKINETLEKMREKGNELLNRPLGEQFNVKIGNFKYGWSGHLGIINFIYNEITMPRVSISALLDSYNIKNSTSHTLNSLRPIQLKFSSGEASTAQKGILEFSVQTQAVGSLEETITKLLERVTILESNVLEINSAIQSINNRLLKNEENIDALVPRVATLEEWKQSLKVTIEGIKVDINNLSESVTNINSRNEAREKVISMKNSVGTETIRIVGETGDITLL